MRGRGLAEGFGSVRHLPLTPTLTPEGRGR